MSEARQRLRRICIAGAGQVAVISAIALRRTLPDAQITVLGLPLLQLLSYLTGRGSLSL